MGSCGQRRHTHVGRPAVQAFIEAGQPPERRGTHVVANPLVLAKALRVTNDERPEVQASAVEFVLEGLHLNKRLNKDRVGGQALYRG